jgi:hypothetical protein
MEDSKGYVWRKNKTYDGFHFLHCSNRNHKKYKCPGYAKLLRIGELEYITRHTTACNMERLRKCRGEPNKKPKCTRRKKRAGIPMRVPTKKFKKEQSPLHYSTESEIDDEESDDQEENVKFSSPLPQSPKIQEQKPLDSVEMKKEISARLKAIEDRIRKRKRDEVDKFRKK